MGTNYSYYTFYVSGKTPLYPFWCTYNNFNKVTCTSVCNPNRFPLTHTSQLYLIVINNNN